MHRGIPLLLATALALLTVFSGCVKSEENGGGTTDDGKKSCDSATKVGLTLGSDQHTVVALATSKGCIIAELYDDKAPATSANFKQYVTDGFYTDVVFHRISKNFVLQTGGYTADGTLKQTRSPIPNEATSSGLKNLKYTFSMARTSDPNSATSQFFVNLRDNTNLDPAAGSAGYAVFGAVIKGSEVVEEIHSVKVGQSSLHSYCVSLEDRQGGSCPVDHVMFWSAKVL